MVVGGGGQNLVARGQVANELTFAFRVKPNVHCMRGVFKVIFHVRSHFSELTPEFSVG